VFNALEEAILGQSASFNQSKYIFVHLNNPFRSKY